MRRDSRSEEASMLDWMTLTIEAIGILIFFVWIVVPVGEFRTIFRRLRQKV